MLRSALLWNIFAVIVAVAASSFPVSGQTESIDYAPPPLKILKKDERTRLNAVKDVGSRTKLALEMMNARLLEAEAAFARAAYDDLFAELGGFHALVDDNLDYLDRHNTGRGKVLDNFKRLEIGLRKFMPRLETIRRELPLRYENYVRGLIMRIRDARTRATEPLFGETVLSRSRSN